MTFTRIKPSNWATGENLTSAQVNALDVDHAHSLDKTTAGDTLAGLITVAGTGGLILQSGASVTGQSGSSVVIQSGAELQLSASSTFNCFGATIVEGPIALVSGAGSLTLGGSSMNLLIGARLVTRVMSGSVDSTDWVGGISWSPSDTAQSSNEPLTFELKVPNGSVLNEVTCRLAGHGGHSFVPAVLPHISVQSIDSSGSLVVLGSSIDGSGTPGSSSVTGYETLHSIDVNGLSVTVDRTSTRYICQVYPESGANVVHASPNVVMILVTWTQVSYEED